MRVERDMAWSNQALVVTRKAGRKGRRPEEKGPTDVCYEVLCKSRFLWHFNSKRPGGPLLDEQTGGIYIYMMVVVVVVRMVMVVMAAVMIGTW